MNRCAARSLPLLAGLVVLVGCTGPAEPTGGESRAGAGLSTTTPVQATPADGGGVLTPAALPFPEWSDGALPAPRQQALRAALDRIVHDSTRVPGVTAAVVSPAGSWAGAAGVDGDAVPLVPQAMIDIASITKTVTAAEVLSLGQAGRVDLDAPATRYLDHPLLQRDPTVRQLLSHTSGIPDYYTASFVDGLDTDPGRAWTADQALGYVSEPPTDPGAPVKSYRNSNHLLLGLLIEQLTGLSYAQAVRRDLLTGVGDRMVVQDTEPPIPPVAAPNLTGTTTVTDGTFLPNRALATAVERGFIRRGSADLFGVIRCR